MKIHFQRNDDVFHCYVAPGGNAVTSLARRLIRKVWTVSNDAVRLGAQKVDPNATSSRTCYRSFASFRCHYQSDELDRIIFLDSRVLRFPNLVLGHVVPCHAFTLMTFSSESASHLFVHSRTQKLYHGNFCCLRFSVWV